MTRIDPAVVKADFAKAGFTLDGEQPDVLAHPDDTSHRHGLRRGDPRQATTSSCSGSARLSRSEDHQQQTEHTEERRAGRCGGHPLAGSGPERCLLVSSVVASFFVASAPHASAGDRGDEGLDEKESSSRGRSWARACATRRPGRTCGTRPNRSGSIARRGICRQSPGRRGRAVERRLRDQHRRVVFQPGSLVTARDIPRRPSDPRGTASARRSARTPRPTGTAPVLRSALTERAVPTHRMAEDSLVGGSTGEVRGDQFGSSRS